MAEALGEWVPEGEGGTMNLRRIAGCVGAGVMMMTVAWGALVVTPASASPVTSRLSVPISGTVFDNVTNENVDISATLSVVAKYAGSTLTVRMKPTGVTATGVTTGFSYSLKGTTKVTIPGNPIHQFVAFFRLIPGNPILPKGKPIISAMATLDLSATGQVTIPSPPAFGGG
jgi:hypothetical protein